MGRSISGFPQRLRRYENTYPNKVSTTSTSPIEVNIYPNPIQDLLTIETAFEYAILFNVTVLKMVQIKSKSTEISNLRAGSYYLKVWSKEGKGVVKLPKI